jgi:hypothetical protein
MESIQHWYSLLGGYLCYLFAALLSLFFTVEPDDLEPDVDKETRPLVDADQNQEDRLLLSPVAENDESSASSSVIVEFNQDNNQEVVEDKTKQLEQQIRKRRKSKSIDDKIKLYSNTIKRKSVDSTVLHNTSTNNGNSSPIEQTVANLDVDIQKNRNSLTQEFILGKNRMNEALSELSKDPSTTLVDLSNTGLKLLPFKLRSCNNLTELNLSNNQLSSLPSWFYKNMTEHLKSLDLSRNNFFEMSQDVILLTGLEKLNLSYNKFEYFPQPVLNCTNLVDLDISHNSVVILPYGISDMKHLQHFDISSNSLSLLPDDLGSLKLKSLKIYDNKFIDSTQRVLQNLYDENPQLEHQMMLDEEKALTEKPEPAIVKQKPKKKIVLTEVDHSKHFQSPVAWQKIPDEKKRTEETIVSTIDNFVELGEGIPEDEVTTEVSTPTDEEPEQIKNIVIEPTPSPISSSNNAEKRVHALLEILESEHKYTHFLTGLYDMYYIPLATDNKQPKINPNSSTLDFSNSDMPSNISKKIFPPDLETIVRFNLELEKALETSIKPSDTQSEINKACIGGIFNTRAPFFKVYTNYISGYENAQRILRDARTGYPQFTAAIGAGRMVKELNGLDFMSLLIMPIQRIPRYSLLLGAIVKYTDPSHSDYEQLTKAVQNMSEIATYVNMKIEETSNRRRVREIEEELDLKGIVAAHRRLVFGGHLLGKKLKDKSTKESEFKGYLLNDMFLLKEFRKILQGILTRSRSHSFSLKDVTLELVSKSSTEFILHVNKKAYIFRTTSSEIQQQWIKHLQVQLTLPQNNQ